MKIALIDDERAELDRLSSLLKARLSAEHELCLFESGEAFLELWRPGACGVVILDIFMSGLTGVELAKKIRETDGDVRLVFATTSNEFASESYEVNACYYLHKPYSAEQVDVMLSRLALDELERSRTVTLPDGQKVLLQDVIYADYYAHIVTIHNKNADNITSRLSLSEAEALLCTDRAFCSPSKGLIVSLREVAALNGDVFVMSSGDRVPVSRRKAKEMKEAYASFRFEALRKGGGCR